MKWALFLFGALLTGCSGCETLIVTPSNGTGGLGGQGNAGGPGGSGGTVNLLDACGKACLNFELLRCPQAEDSPDQDGNMISCEDLCRQIPELERSAGCVASARSCNEADLCSTGE